MTFRLDAVVFDLGGVLIDWNPRYLYRTLFDGDDAAMERFLSDVCSPAWNVQQDAGRPWREAVETLARLHPDQRELIAAYDERWPEMLGGSIQGTVEILAELRAAGRRLAVLSNWSAEKFPIARARFDFLDWFEAVVISGDVGVGKPDARIYRHLLARSGFDPRSTAFVDDSAANVAAAAELGMTALVFRDPATLRADLTRLGLMPLAG
jgi:haloacid dehalogenase superfamily, subfamily IA, variant 3 with third motif having DD or ED